MITGVVWLIAFFFLVIGAVVFIIIFSNILKKGFRPITIIPTFLILGALFLAFLVGGFYSLSSFARDINIPGLLPSSSSEQSGNSLYR